MIRSADYAQKTGINTFIDFTRQGNHGLMIADPQKQKGIVYSIKGERLAK
jgi:hypothetical protein